MEGYDVPPSWQAALATVLASPQSAALAAFLSSEEAAGKQIYPPQALRFHALEATSLSQVKAVILGQDPYLKPGEAQGLSFSVPREVRIPPSLKNIQQELLDDLGIEPAGHGNLESWAAQGILLLNDLLTVERGIALSHKKRGWEAITDAIITAVAARSEPCVFLLWGDKAKEKISRVPSLSDDGRHLLLKTSHPSNMGGAVRKGFFGCRHFSKANAFLEANGRVPIDWRT